MCHILGPGHSRLGALLPSVVTTKNVLYFQTLPGVGGGCLYFRNTKQSIFIPPIYVYQVHGEVHARHSAGRQAFIGEEWHLKPCHKMREMRQQTKCYEHREENASNCLEHPGQVLWPVTRKGLQGESRSAVPRPPFLDSIWILSIISFQAPYLFPWRINFFLWKMEIILRSVLPTLQSWIRKKPCGTLWTLVL